MRVLQIINSMGTGGAEKLILETLPKYREQGIDMNLLLLNGTEHPFLLEFRNTCDATVDVLSQGSVYNPFRIFKLISFIKGYDLIHVHLFPALYWVALAKLISRSKIPLIFTEHNTTNNRRDHFLLKHIDKIMYRRYSKIITISPEVDHLLKRYLNEKPTKFVLIPNGVNVEKINSTAPSSRSEFSSKSDEKIIIQVSSFTKQKDQKTLIKALSILSHHIKLLLVGIGPLEQECRDLVTEIELEDRVAFLGLRMDVPALLKMADIVVLSTHYEGLSLSSMEALASGTPFVASRAPGLTKVVEGAGILFPIGDYLQLSKEINQLIEDSKRYSKTATLCLERAKKYDQSQMIEHHLNVYNQICLNKN